MKLESAIVDAYIYKNPGEQYRRPANKFREIMMKKLLLPLLFCAVLSPLALRAELIPAEKVAAPVLKEALSEKYGCKINEKGDLIINGKNGKIFVKVLAKAQLIRVFCYYGAYRKRTTQEMIELANRFNWDRRLLRVSVNPERGDCACDYALVYTGGLNSENLVEAIDWFDNLMRAWETFVINGGDKPKK